MTYRIVFSTAARKDLRRIRDQHTLRQLSSAIARLADDAYPAGARKLRIAEDIWRIRIGTWRICYTVEDGQLVILILAIVRRGEVNERLRRRLE